MNETTRLSSGPSVFWPTVWLAVILVTIKATYVGLAVFWDWAGPRDYLSWLYLKWVAAAGQADFLFALGAGLLGALLLLVLRKHRRASRFVAVVFVILGVIGVWYTVVGRQFFEYFGAPLTWQMLALGGSPRELSSSLAPFLTLPVIAAMLGAPAGYVLLVVASNRLTRGWSSRYWLRARIAGMSLGALWLLLGQDLKGSGWFESQDRYVGDSPLWVLAESFSAQVAGARANLRADGIRPGDLCELGRAAKPLSPRTPTIRAPQNVILIVLESVGTEFLSTYGSGLGTTPNLAAEQANSLTFDAYYTPVGWTAYALYSIVLSKRPPIQGYNTTTFRLAVPEGQTLAAILSQQGYRTLFMSAGDPDWASEGFFEDKGFTEIRKGADLGGAKPLSSWGYEDRYVFDGMVNWLEQELKQPFFLMAWTDQTHHPYKLGAEQKEMELLRPDGSRVDKNLTRYLTLIHEVDRHLGRLFATLRRQGLAENTLVVITGDHGEAFGRLHNNRGHGFTVYDEELKVPLILWNPKLFADGRRSAVVGSHVDLSATILEALGLATPPEWDGRSLLSQSAPVPTYFFAAGWGENLLGLRQEHWKYSFDARRGREELFDVVADPSEKTNVAEANQEVSRRLRQRLAAWLELNRKGAEEVRAACEGDWKARDTRAGGRSGASGGHAQPGSPPPQ